MDMQKQPWLRKGPFLWFQVAGGLIVLLNVAWAWMSNAASAPLMPQAIAGLCMLGLALSVRNLEGTRQITAFAILMPTLLVALGIHVINMLAKLA